MEIVRSLTDPVILSTLGHFLPLYFVVGCNGALYLAYSTVITLSSCMSIVWHSAGEKKNWTFWLDYGLALAWTTTDFVMAISLTSLPVVLIVFFLNAITIMNNQFTDYLARKDLLSYEVGHSCWHILSFSKSILVAYLIGCREIC